MSGIISNDGKTEFWSLLIPSHVKEMKELRQCGRDFGEHFNECLDKWNEQDVQRERGK